ncbi:MAG: transporter substrate-binding domain-containing protein [Chloroflexota bacterium]|nr:transporter substrate-binding domain-containing protein [Chloroflexota bacterium]
MSKHKVARLRLLFLLLIAVLCVACGFPRDPNNTLEQVRGGTLRVGAVENEPWVMREDDQAVGIEAELVKELAQQLEAQIEWTWGTEQEMLEKLQHFELDLVVGGLVESTPWRNHIALTNPYYQERVIAVPPGENGWLMRVEEFLQARRSSIRETVQEVQP